MLADLLRDRPHKAIYIRLAKNYDEGELMGIAKEISQNKNIINRGAYFMKIVQSLPKSVRKPIVKKPKIQKKKQKELFKWKKK